MNGIVVEIPYLGSGRKLDFGCYAHALCNDDPAMMISTTESIIRSTYIGKIKMIFNIYYIYRYHKIGQ